MLRIIAILLIITGLTACNTTQIQSTDISTNKQLEPGKGVVAVQVINNAERLAQWHKGWTEVIIFRTDNMDQLKQQAIEQAKAKHKGSKPFDPTKVDWDPEFYTLTPHDQGVIDSQIFVGSIPQGEYVISSLYAYYNGGDFSSWLSMPVMFSAGKFKVEENKLTSLGSVVFQPLLNIKEKSFWSNTSSQKAYVTRVEKQQDLKSFILEHYPNLANQLQLEQTLDWSSDNLNEFRGKLSDLSRTNAYGNQTMALTKLGKNVIASKFGSLKWQDNQGTWHKTNLDTNSQLAAAIEIDNSVVVGGELGQVFISDNLNDNWQRYQPVSPKEAISWFGKSNNNDYYALTQSASEFVVYQIKDIKTTWEKLTSFKRKSKGIWVQNGGLHPFINGENQISIVNDNKLFTYSNNTKKWSQTKTTSLVDMAQLANGTLVGVEVSQWDGVGDQVVSLDYGQTWLDVNRYLNQWSDLKLDRSLPIVLKDNTVISIGRKKTAKNGKSKTTLKIISTDAQKVSDKKSWTFHHAPKDNCFTMLPNISQQSTIHMLCDQGQIVASDNFGKTWQEVVSIDVTAMQQTYNEMVAQRIKENKEKEEKEQQAEQKGESVKEESTTTS
jgi:hypothetical protein